MFDLTGKIAVVTGGSRGIGRATSIALAQAGARVLVNYRSNEDRRKGNAAPDREAGGQGELLGFDVADPESVDRGIKEAVERHGADRHSREQCGNLDRSAVVESVGKGPRDDLGHERKRSDILRQRVHPPDDEEAVGADHQHFERRGGVRQCRSGGLFHVEGCAFGPNAHVGPGVRDSRGITVNAVAPGFIETDMTADLPDTAKQGIFDQTPLGRIGRPEEVAAAVVFLASEEASYITGQVVRVNGGMHV